MRASEPRTQGYVSRDGVRLGYEVHGDGEAAILLMPTWTIIHSRFWKAQVPNLARRHTVITYDAPGNGRSDRSVDPQRYGFASYAKDAVAVLDECGVERAVLVGLSLGAPYSAWTAYLFGERVAGLVLNGASLDLTVLPERAAIASQFLEPPPEDPQGWQKFNLAYWHASFPDFAQFFFEQCFNEPHSTKQIEDAVGWAMEANSDVMAAEAHGPGPDPTVPEVLAAIECPTLVIHGTHDRISPHADAVEAARLTGGRLLTLQGSGHVPLARDPVKVNLAIAEFVGDGPEDTMPERTWIRAASRPRRVLYLSSPIGLGHARRDLAIAGQLREFHPDLQIDWLAQHPVTTVLEAEGEAIHPASRWLASESGHIASESHGHDLHCFQALRNMDEILVYNFMIFQEVVEEGQYDLVVTDEAWDIDRFWHENPELKRCSHAWMTDFVGYLPMGEGGSAEEALTADYNAEMIEWVERFPRVRDRAVFVGNPDDIVPETFGPGLPKIRDWTEQHFDFSGYITGFAPPDADEVAELRSSFGYGEDDKICVVTVGGSGVGGDLLATAIAAFPLAAERIPGLRMVAVAGPRIDPDSLPRHEGLEVVGYVDCLHRHLSVCDLAVVQGGLTTTMELTAAKRPFISFPLGHHFEQNFHVRHRLAQYGASRQMSYRETDLEALADAMVEELGSTVSYRDVETDGAERAARLIAELI